MPEKCLTITGNLLLQSFFHHFITLTYTVSLKEHLFQKLLNQNSQSFWYDNKTVSVCEPSVQKLWESVEYTFIDVNPRFCLT